MDDEHPVGPALKPKLTWTKGEMKCEIFHDNSRIDWIAGGAVTIYEASPIYSTAPRSLPEHRVVKLRRERQ